MSVVILGSALKHGFSEREVREAWKTVRPEDLVRVRKDKQPPHYMGVGFLPNGKIIEMIAFSTGYDFYVFHANSPLSASFKIEYRENGGLL